MKLVISFFQVKTIFLLLLHSERTIEISNIPRQIVVIRQEDSISIKELQAVDFIAWALYQKYEHNDVSFYKMISSLIIEEEIVSKQSWYED
ncbi:MAG: hypothetical protein CVU40_12905 [Chloroflexi bacterium HGW-Chloroflexi-2]|jgi:hypothetical protein|nr:MAG: hypothetical protein CVU40_12905 [Chloroflexi bacterium HGW-Chloroflexi-2]